MQVLRLLCGVVIFWVCLLVDFGFCIAVCFMICFDVGLIGLIAELLIDYLYVDIINLCDFKVLMGVVIIFGFDVLALIDLLCY